MSKFLDKIPIGRIVTILKSNWEIIAIGAVAFIVLLIVVIIVVKIIKKRGHLKGEIDKEGIEWIGEDDCEIITDRIDRYGEKNDSFLFAGAGLDCLPITIPVNVAIELAEDDNRCLLIDLDLRRDAVAKAFDIDTEPNIEQLKPRPRKTAVENLMIWPAHNFTRSMHMNIKLLVQAATESYDYVLINAPYIESSPDRAQIAMASDCCFIFTKTAKQVERLEELIDEAESELIGNIRIKKKEENKTEAEAEPQAEDEE